MYAIQFWQHKNCSLLTGKLYSDLSHPVLIWQRDANGGVIAGFMGRMDWLRVRVRVRDV